MSISERRKSRVETPPIVSKSRRTQRRPFRVRATKLPRRRFLHMAAGAAALPAVSRFAMAQAYPSRPARIIVAAAAGGSADITARLIGQWLTERLGQSFLVENRPGGNSNIGTEAVVRAPADGYTLLLATSTNAINASLYERLSYNFIRDVAPVAYIADTPLVMVVPPRFPAKTVAEFITYANATSGKLNMGSAGAGPRTTSLASCLRWRPAPTSHRYNIGARHRPWSICLGRRLMWCSQL
jgi:tripartite-type tricarboxylate transporter receptor subunit TctC